MTYRIVEWKPNASQCTAKHHLALGNGKEVGSFDSAYTAMKEMSRSFLERGRRPLDWYLVDPVGDILMEPQDLYELGY